MLVAFSNSHNEGIVYSLNSQKVCYFLEKKKISEMPLCRNFFYFKSNITFLIQDKFWLLMNTNISRLADTESWILKAKKFYMFRNFTLIFTFFLIKNVKYTWFTILCSFSVYSNVMIQFELCFYICMLFS